MLGFSYSTAAAATPAPGLLGSVWLGAAPRLTEPVGTTLQLPLRRLDSSEVQAQHWWVQGPVQRGAAEQGGIALQWAQDGQFLFVCAQADPGLPMAQQSHQAYQALLQCLRAHGKPHPLRIWNYVPRINAHEDGVERYQAFNSGRRRAFREQGYSLAEGAPAACVLGSHQGCLQIAVLSGLLPPQAIENPRQVSAYHYPAQYGVAPPLFSRAARWRQPGGADLLLISGTASIVGHASLHLGDVQAQTREALRNIEAVLQQTADQGVAPWQLSDLAGRVYLRHAQDLPVVQACLAERGLRNFSYVEADICRGDLLVEIEAEAQAPLAMPA